MLWSDLFNVNSFQGINNIVKYALKSAMELGYAKQNDAPVMLYSQSEEYPDTENIMKIETA